MRRNESQIIAFRYCLTLVATALALVSAVATFNVLVNPFGMYGHSAIDGVNAYKPSIFNRVRLYKAYELRRVRPQAIILGTSRTHIGISCSHEAWTRVAGPCYNLAFDGATTREMFHYLRHAHAIRSLRHVVLGLDAYQVTAAPSSVRPDFDPYILRDPETPAWWRFITGDIRLLASMDTFAASVDTVRSQAYPQPSWFTGSGQRLGDVFFRREDENFMRYGPRAYFDEIDRLEVGFQTEGASPLRRDVPAEAEATSAEVQESALDYIRRIVEFCRHEGIDLRIFITPSHAHQLEIAAAAGSLASMQNGKRALVSLLAEDAARHLRQAPIPLIDFSGYSTVTTEPLPSLASREEMRNYWDSSHFKENVGNYVLDHLFGLTSASPPVPTDFGVTLTTSNVETALTSQRAAQSAYRKRFPEEIEALHSLVRAKVHLKQAEPIASAASTRN